MIATAPSPTKLPQLRGMLERLEAPRYDHQRTVLSTGVTAVDRLLPQRGLQSGMLVEWVADGPGSGASLLPVAALKNLQHTGGAIVVIDREGHFYPPAASAWGIDLQHTIVIRPTTEADELWAIDQALRSPDVAAVLAWPERIDSFTFRRLQLAAEASGAIGLLVRPKRAQQEPSWAAARLLVSPLPSSANVTEWEESNPPDCWKLNVSVLRSRRGRPGQSVELEVDEQTGNIHEAIQHPTTDRLPARAGRLATQLAHRASHEQTA